MATMTDKDVEVQLSKPIIEADAKAATEKEHELDIRTAVKLYPKAVAWSIFFSLGVIMCGFDPQVIGNLFPVPKFQEDFGYLYKGEYIISAAWQSGLRYVCR